MRKFIHKQGYFGDATRYVQFDLDGKIELVLKDGTVNKNANGWTKQSVLDAVNRGTWVELEDGIIVDTIPAVKSQIIITIPQGTTGFDLWRTLGTLSISKHRTKQQVIIALEMED